MEAMIEPESWNDLDMDWTDPDPSKFCYYLAILKAMDERRKALASSGFRSWHYSELIYRRNRFHIPSVESMKNLIYDMLHHTLAMYGKSIVRKEDFFHDETAWDYGSPPSLQERLTPVVTYPVPGIGSPLSQAKEFLKWARKTLDAMTMFLYPVIKMNLRVPDAYAEDHLEKMYRDELEGITDKDARLERLAELYIHDYADHYMIKSEVQQDVFYMGMQAESDDHNGIAVFSVHLPESIEIRSFTKPRVYCLVKVFHAPEQLSQYVFEDFGYGFEEGKNKVLDLGQVSEDNGGKIELFKFDLKDMKQYLLTGGRIRYILQAYCHFALDYNCEGGFKFRPDE